MKENFLDQFIMAVGRLESKSTDLADVKATLEVNCLPGRVLETFGIDYDINASVHANVYRILSKLVELIPTETFQDGVRQDVSAARGG